jgi:hypothetical protein
MKILCLLRERSYHTTAWLDPTDIALGSRVEIHGLVGIWEIIEVYPRQTVPSSLRYCYELEPGAFGGCVGNLRH